MATDFGLLPPELNSSRMYQGPGSDSMLTAANAWESLAAALNSAATSYAAVITGLSVELWLGPASATMAAAAAPFAGWLAAAATQAEQTAAGARRATTAYETAFAMTVPPPLIEANRNQVMSLVTTNTLGQNTPVIEAMQAEYAEMWAQDAAAMFSYAASSQAAATLSPFTAPIPAADPAGPAAQAAAVGSAAGTDIQTLLTALMSPTSAAVAAPAAAIPTPVGDLDILATYLAGISTASMSLSILNSFRPWIFAYGHPRDNDDADGDGVADAGPLGPTQGSVVKADSDRAPTSGSAASAGVGQAALVGALAVPHSWTVAAPEIRLAVESLPSAAAAPVPTNLDGAPAALLGGMALAGLAGRGATGSGSQPAADTATEEDGQPKRKPTVVVIQQPPPATGPTGHRPH